MKPEAAKFDYVIDAVDTALYVAAEDGMPAGKRFMDRLGLTTDAAFLATVQGLVNAIPRSEGEGAVGYTGGGLAGHARYAVPAVDRVPGGRAGG